MKRVLGIACLLALLPSPSSAEDAKPAAPPPADAKPAAPPAGSAPVPKPPPPTPEQAADTVLAAVKAKDDAALKALITKDETDPWLIADELCRRGERDAASAFAKAVPRPDVEALPRYIEARRARGPDDVERGLLASMNTAMSSRQPQAVVDGTETLAPEVDTVLRVRLLHVRGSALWGMQRWRDCGAVSRRAADAALAMGWLTRAWQLYDRAVESALRVQDGAQALASLEARLRIDETWGNAEDAARAFCQIGIAHTNWGDRAKAGPAFDQALARYEALNHKPGVAWVLYEAANHYKMLGDHKKAISLFERAVPLHDALRNQGIAADAVNSMGTSYTDLGEYPKALAKLKDALARAEALGEKQAVAGVLVNLGNAYRGQGDRANAMAHLERGRALAEEIGKREWLLNAMHGIALVHTDSGDHAKALAMFQQLLVLRERWGDRAGAAATVKLIGDVYAGRGDYTKAVATYQRALVAFDALGDRSGAAGTLLPLGLAFLGLGDCARSLSTQEQALARWQALGDKAGAAGALINMGNVYRDLGDPASALAHYQRGLALTEEIGHRHWRANALANIGGTYLDTGDPARALAAYEQGLAEYEALRQTGDATKALRNIGSAYGAMHETEKALPFFLKALERSEASGDSWMVALTCGDVAGAYANLKDFDKARAFFERGERVARSRRLASLLVGALTNLATFHLERGENAAALTAAKDALGQTETLLGGLGEELGAAARAQHARLFEHGTLAAVREKDLPSALMFLESGRAGALLDDLDKREALRWKAESLSPELQRLDLDAQAKERTARDAYEQASRGDDLAAQRAASKALDDAAQEVRDVTGRIQRELKLQAAFFYPRAKSIEEIRSTLRADEALVIYGLCWEEALALVLRPDGGRIVALGAAADVVAACESLDAKDPGVDPKLALDALRKRLVEPLALEEGVKQVLVSPDGPLCYVPFALLFGQTVAMTPSGTTHALLLDEEGQPGRGILALGDPDYAGVSAGSKAIYQRGRPLTSLPATRVEATSIGSWLLLGVDANEAKLYEALASSTRWRAVHFACHGLINTDKPMLSSLALTRAGDGDGFFTALEVLRTKIPADLVVLSACETATGKIVNGEGIVGLTRAFMFAGTPRVICSLWKVDDEATRALMTEFYRLWSPKDGKPGLSTAEALRRAQEHVKSQEKWKHPYFWAAWVLWGLPS